ncbi:NAD-dependent epimerase/dehydratase family protein [Candidatus Giovannonibacteria bacterium]|nr:NAD-dependent epimerase/dehydratase family protein [Candidatus Giovannonibacteria bacterium]
MKVLVTGGQGFIGSHVIERLLKMGHKAISFDRRFVSKKQVCGVEYFIGDVCDADAVNQAVYAADAVINLSGILGTAETLQHVPETMRVNVLGTINVFEALRKYDSLKKRCVYITLPDVWQNPYAISKRTAKDLALYVYNQELGTEIQVVRAFNVYGERQKYKPVRKFAPSFIIRALTGQPLQVYGDGGQMMDLVYAGDTADILIMALEAPKVASEVIDAGSGEGVPVIMVAKLISEITGAPIEYLPMRKGETSKAVIRGDTSTLERWLGKYEFTPIREGMRRTVEWYKKHYKELI